ncbi:glycosyltransferase [Arthrobacter citreus]|uniref:Glycosyltransferase n=1 Tax=Arthrobacter citreus TaxID=1670 RepID=A0ABZ2ZWU3_9MICC
MTRDIQRLRTLLWHFRNGGFEQLRKHRGTKVDSGSSAAAKKQRISFLGKGSRLAFEPFDVGVDDIRRSDLTVAVILDEFSSLAFQHEWNQVSLHPQTWASELEASKPDLLFVESAWNGNGGLWKYELTGASGPKKNFLQLLETCRELGIPTVFWNKEDPPHYQDFLDAAKHFDHVFTSDSDRLVNYQDDLGHDNVGVLQFAAQPALHNPIRPRSGWHERGVAFAGMYFAHKFPERREQLDLLLAAATRLDAKGAAGLEIFSRHAEKSADYRFPSDLTKFVRGSLSYPEMLTAYKAFKVFLNVNSVVNSPTMCARRIFEISAAGTSVVSTPSVALGQTWAADEQFIVQTAEDAEQVIDSLIRNPELSDRQLHKAQRRIWSDHTYAHRAEQVISSVLPSSTIPVAVPDVSLLVSTIRPHQIRSVFQSVANLARVETELILATHGFHLPAHEVRDLQREFGVENVAVLERPRSVTLGDCLNDCVKASSGSVLSKMDDDDFYAPNYMIDMVHALAFSKADVVGKQAHYVFVAESDVTVLRYADREHRFTSAVMGPTITARRSVFENVQFQGLSLGEDTAFLRDVKSGGGRIYSGDRFNYFQYRGNADHTWKIPDAKITASGKVVFFGSPGEHVAI